MASAPILSGRRIAITGAGRGLGRALAITAADHGANLLLLGRNATALSGVADVIRARGGREVGIVPCDLAQADSVTEACRQTLAAAPVVDVLINNGAPWLPGSIEELADGDIATTVAATVTGTVLITKGLLPGLRRSAAADIVTLVSTAGLLGQYSGTASAAFHAAKHGQSGFSDRLREELKRYGIRVTAIYPPDFDDTDPLDAAWNKVRDPATGAKLTNREVVAAVMFAITAPRVCAYPVIVLDNMVRE
jgi:NAD(P)-dependent dehydrogenase (short-subunit alcohol dehydrogenase family)